MRNLGVKIVLGIAVLALAGCGGGGNDTTQDLSPLQAAEQKAKQPPKNGELPREVTIDGYASSENVGILLADRLGYFAEAGLDIDVSDPLTPVNTVNYAVHKGSVLTISHQPQVVEAVDKGLPVVAVGSVVSTATLALIWLPDSGIKNVADLKGKTIAITGMSFEVDLLRAILRKAGLTLADVKVERVDNEGVPALVKGRADAILGTWSVEGCQLKARGLEPVVNWVEELGVPGYDELEVITHRDRLASEPQMIRAFMSAVTRGNKAAAENPQLAVEAIADAQHDFAHGGYQPKPTVAEVEETLPLLSRTGFMDPRGGARLSDWMYREGFVGRRLPPSAFMTNDS